MRAIVLDRPHVLKVAEEMAKQYGVEDRLECHAADMFTDPLPSPADAVLLSNVLHDWDVPQCKALLARCADALPSGGELIIHDAFINDEHDGPEPIAIYSIILFYLTEGRAYSEAEYKQWLGGCGLVPGQAEDTLVHCKALKATK